MKVLQISDNAVVSGSFNGYRLRPFLAEEGIDSLNVAWLPEEGHPNIATFMPNTWARYLAHFARKAEYHLGLQGLLYLQSLAFPLTRTFRGADVIHLHLIHNYFFSLLALPLFARFKPVIWTWHDPWALTGHCVHPKACDRWKIGCGACPDLETHFPIARDNTAFNWKLKRWAYSRGRPEIVVASRWMEGLARESPLTQGLTIHEVPFGVDLAVFSPGSRAEARRALDIPADHRVFLVRATPGPFKGLPEFLRAMEQVQIRHPTTALVLANHGMVEPLRGRVELREVGWVHDPARMALLLQASDFVVMPSMAESFGLLAAEALACERVVLGFDGTALPDTAAAPEHGLMVPYGDAGALATALQGWLDDPARAHRREAGARAVAEDRYGSEVQARKLAKIYRDAAARHPRGTGR